MSETLIAVERVSKAFSLRDKVSRKALARELWSIFMGQSPRRQLAPSSFLALDDVSFTVARGEVLGVIGHNGAGKTTLLRVLSGEYLPESGHVEVRGTRSNLVDLTSGFSRDMTGRENIYFRGAHLGFSREFLKEREHAIVDFAGIGEFIDADMRKYSSGMLLRLGFAVSVFVEPDVLLIDEILTVGDFIFAAKCMRKLNELKPRAAIVLVTHNLGYIVQFANKALVLDRGKPAFLGDPVQAVAHYQRLEVAKASLGKSRLSRSIQGIQASNLTETELAPQATSGLKKEIVPPRATGELGVSLPKPSQSHPDKQEEAGAVVAQRGPTIYNQSALSDVRCWWCRRDGTPVDAFEGHECASLRISFIALEPIQRLAIGVLLWSSDGVYITCFATHGRPTELCVPAGARHIVTLDVEALHLNRGSYFPVVAIVNGGEHLYRQPGPILQILSNRAVLGWGLLTLDYQWRQESVVGESAKVVRQA